MNYLAHVLLAEPTPEARLGALLGDFSKGLELESLPVEVRASVLEHRAIDRFVDTHPLVVAERARFAPDLRRFAGILLDVFYDHFLVQHWTRFAAEPLAELTADLYATLDRHRDLLPPRLLRVAPYMQRDDWLGSYGDPRSVRRALEGIASRLRRSTPLATGIRELEERREALEAHFLALFPEVRTFVLEHRSS